MLFKQHFQFIFSLAEYYTTISTKMGKKSECYNSALHFRYVVQNSEIAFQLFSGCGNWSR